MKWPWRRAEEIDEEIRSHLRMAAEDTGSARAARRDFGSTALAMELTRDAWGFRWLRDAVHDLRFAARLWRRAPLISLVVVAILALGIGSATALFSVSDGMLRHKGNWYRWGVITARTPQHGTRIFRFSLPEYLDITALHDIFEGTGALAHSSMALSAGEFPERVACSHITADIVNMNSPATVIGRGFRGEEDRPGGPLVALLSYELWQSRFHGDSSIAGKKIRLDGLDYEVVGVTPPHESAFGSDVMVPLQPDLASPDRSRRDVWVLVLLKPGITWEQADRRLAQLAHTIERTHRGAHPEYAGFQLEFWNGYEANTGGIRPAITVLLAAVGLLLLICCANVGSLLLSRTAARTREYAVRAAIGAHRGRIVRQTLAETLGLAAIGAAAGVALAYAALPALVSLIPATWMVGDASQIAINGKVLAAAVALALATGIVFGLAPAWQASRFDLAGAMKGSGAAGGLGRRGARLRGALVAAQIAVTLVVLAGAALMIQSYRELARADLGFHPDHVLSFQIELPATRYAGAGAIAAFYREAESRLAHLPGVDGAAVVSGLPMMDRTVDLATQDFTIEGRPADNGAAPANANYRLIGPRYFDVMGAAIRRGRAFDDRDHAGTAAVAIVNQTMAARFWPGADPLGQRIRLSRSGAVATIVGVSADVKQIRLINAPVRPEFYLPHAQFAANARAMSILVSTPLDAGSVTSAARAAIAAIDPQLPLYDVLPMRQVVADSFGPGRITTVLLAFFGAVALPLAAIGLYALLAYSVAQRAPEVGLRKALGAQSRHIVGMLLRDGMRLALWGIGCGVVAAWVLLRILAAQSYGITAVSMLYTVDAQRWVVLAGVALLIAVVALAACLIPARRAVRMDPTVALRQ